MKSMEYREWLDKHVKIGKEVLWVTQKEVEEMGIPRETVFELTEKALAYHGKKEVEMPAKIGIHPHTQPNTLMHAMPGYIPAEYIACLKWGGCFPENRQKFNLPQTSGLMVYNDHESGIPVAVTDAVWITKMRTAAVSMAGAKYLANPKTEVAAQIGCGVQGTEHVKFMELALPHLKEILIYDVYPAAMDALIKECQPSVKAKIVKTNSFEEVVKGAETVFSTSTITSSPSPKIKDEWVRAGQTLILVDMHTLYDDKTMKRADKYLVDSIEEHVYFESIGYYPHGLPEIYGETGEVVAGIKKGRESKDELIVDNNTGMSVEDAMVVKHIVGLALERKIGRLLPL
ncbi:MAG TPA: ornithine cyclodeaminase [Synergistaceae bacterium]|jgi:ornithine cyclodeaminase/alanine dehydrogenase|nr:ornithine cyclodeaminase [Synergistaceae bacterium]